MVSASHAMRSAERPRDKCLRTRAPQPGGRYPEEAQRRVPSVQRGRIEEMTEQEIRNVLARRPRLKNESRRRSLSKKARVQILAKTAGTCHVCVGTVDDRWQADHIVPHSHGGSKEIENFLPICGECNRLRWSYPPDVIRLILRLGIFAKHEIRSNTPLGRDLTRRAAARFRTTARRKSRRALDDRLV